MVNRHAVCPNMKEKYHETTEIRLLASNTPDSIRRIDDDSALPTLASAKDEIESQASDALSCKRASCRTSRPDHGGGKP